MNKKSFFDNLGMVAGKAISSGTLAGGISYFVLKRTDLVEVMGIEMTHWQYDLAVVAVSSEVADASTVWVLPFLEDKLNSGHKFNDFINMSISPILCGTASAIGNKFIIQPNSTEPMKDFLLGIGCKLGGDRVYDSLMSK